MRRVWSVVITSIILLSWPLVAPANGGMLRGALSSDILNWDPIYAVDVTTGHMVSLVYSTLFNYDTELNLVPELVADYTVGNDQVYHFILRDDIHFTTGEKLTAYDVIYSWQRLKDPELLSPRGFLLDNVAHMEAVAANQVLVKLKEPSREFLYLTTMPNLAIVPEGSDNLKEAPVGSGPWELSEWQAQEKIVFKANQDYPLPGPYTDYLQFTILGELQQILRFEAGVLDFVHVSAEILPRWQAKFPELLVEQEKPNVYYVGLTYHRKPFNQVAVRKALNYATNRPEITQHFLNGLAVVAHGPVPPQVGGITEKKYTYQPERAKELLQGKTLSFELWVVNDPTLLGVARILKAQWAEVGIEVDIILSDFSGLLQATTEGAVDSFLMGWTMDYPLKENFLVPTFTRANWGAGGNRAYFYDEQLEELIQQGAWDQAEQRIIEEAPWVFLWHGVEAMALQPWVNGFQPHPIYYGQDFRQVTLERE